MGLPETNTHSFIIKIWLEETPEETERVVWRGHITHVPSGERRYLKECDDVVFFILPYLEQMGVQLSGCQRVQRWFHQLRQRSGRASR